MAAVYEVYVTQELTVRVVLDEDKYTDEEDLFDIAEDDVMYALEDAELELPVNMVVSAVDITASNVAKVN